MFAAKRSVFASVFLLVPLDGLRQAFEFALDQRLVIAVSGRLAAPFQMRTRTRHGTLLYELRFSSRASVRKASRCGQGIRWSV